MLCIVWYAICPTGPRLQSCEGSCICQRLYDIPIVHEVSFCTAKSFSGLIVVECTDRQGGAKGDVGPANKRSAFRSRKQGLWSPEKMEQYGRMLDHSTESCKVAEISI